MSNVDSHPIALPAGWQVPSFELTEFAAKSSDYCIVIPILNEDKRIQVQLEGMQKLTLPADVIIADGGSSDGSTDPERLKKLGVSVLLVKRGKGALSAQLRMGFAYALVRGYRGIVTIDGNNKDGYEAIPRFVQALRDGFQFVQGSRYVPGGEAIATPLDRTLALRLVHAPLLSIAAGFRYTDTTNGFRAYGAEFLRDSRTQPFRDVFSTYNLHYYLSVRAPRLGYRVVELPVRRSYPRTGKVPTKISGLASRWLIVKQLLLTMFGAYNPDGS
jgi:dolichol-phosphate mannosyltransferase